MLFSSLANSRKLSKEELDDLRKRSVDADSMSNHIKDHDAFLTNDELVARIENLIAKGEPTVRERNTYSIRLNGHSPGLR